MVTRYRRLCTDILAIDHERTCLVTTMAAAQVTVPGSKLAIEGGCTAERLPAAGDCRQERLMADLSAWLEGQDCSGARRWPR
jgi:hypothetical protein